MLYTVTDVILYDAIKCPKLKCGEWFHCQVLNILWNVVRESARVISFSVHILIDNREF